MKLSLLGLIGALTQDQDRNTRTGTGSGTADDMMRRPGPGDTRSSIHYTAI